MRPPPPIVACFECASRYSYTEKIILVIVPRPQIMDLGCLEPVLGVFNDHVLGKRWVIW